MLFINATLSKNQLYKHEIQINKFPTISKQEDIELFSNISARYFTNVFSSFS